MATFVPVANVAEVVIKGLLAGQQINNIVHLKNSAGWDAGTLFSAVGDLIIAWRDNIRPLLSSDFLFTGAHAKDLTTSMGIEVDVPWIGAAGGAIGNAAADGNVALCIGHKTGFAGRSARGRTFIAGLPENSTTDDAITDAFKASWQTAMDNIVAAMATRGTPWGVVSKYSGYTQTPPKYKKVPTPRVAGIFNGITTNVFDKVVDSQRRRLPGRGV